LAFPGVGMVRFGRWKDILLEPMPAADFASAQGLWHAARGLALLKTGDRLGATRELSETEAIRQRMAPDAKLAMNAARDVLAIAVDVLAAELSLAGGDFPSALSHFQKAVAAEDALNYDEPPDWGLPVRHQLGAALLAAGRPAEAEEVYRADLQRHPHNGWALFGLAKSLEAQGKTAQAADVQRQFTEAWKRADVQLTASVF
jgi:tetratricopeptide (TPR) repeat protein